MGEHAGRRGRGGSGRLLVAVSCCILHGERARSAQPPHLTGAQAWPRIELCGHRGGEQQPNEEVGERAGLRGGRHNVRSLMAVPYCVAGGSSERVASSSTQRASSKRTRDLSQRRRRTAALGRWATAA